MVDFVITDIFGEKYILSSYNNLPVVCRINIQVSFYLAIRDSI